MPLSRNRIVLIVLAAVLPLTGLGVAVTRPHGAAFAQAVDPELYAPWDSLVAEARARRGMQASVPPRAFQEHGYDQGLAISPDGGLLVSATPRQPTNSLDVIDPDRRTGWRIAHPHPRVGLIEPAFSPDGRKLAFVVGLPSPAAEFTGVSAIWIVDCQGRRLQVIAAPGRLYRHPVFSADGQRLAYARDVFEPVGPRPPLPPENQSAKPLSLFETDLATGRERRLSQERYGYLRPVAYGPQGTDLYFQASMRLVPASPGSPYLAPDRAYWQSIPPPPAPVPLQLFRVALADGAIGDVGPDFAPIPGRGPGGVLGLTPDGGVLLFDAQTEGRDRLAWSIYRADGAKVRRAAGDREPRYVQGAAVSPGEAYYAAVLTAAVAPGSPFDVQGFLLGRLDDAAAPTHLALSDIRFRREPVLLDSAQPPTGRQPR